MKKVRRIPRKVGYDDEEASLPDDIPATNQPGPESVVKRPALTPRGSSRVKKPSTLRASFTPLGQDGNDEDDASPVVKKPGLARQALERNAPERLPFRTGGSTPSYSSDYLVELRSSQPSTPRDLIVLPDDPLDELEMSSSALHIASKFGPSANALIHPSSIPPPSLIPTATEIREKKERRRRLAAEEKAEDFISLDTPDNDRALHAAAASDDDSDQDRPRHHRSLIIPAEQFDPEHSSKYAETRLVRDDEDIAEGFDDFVEDSGKVTLSRAGFREQESIRRREMEAQIRAAQGGDDSAEDDDEDGEVDGEEAARLRAYEAAQTRAGTYGERSTGVRTSEREKEARLHRRLAHTPRIAPVPDFKSVLGRWREMVGVKEEEVRAAQARLDAVRREKEEVRADEARVVVLLEEAGKRFETLRGEVATKRAIEGGMRDGAVARGRGLESLGEQVVATPVESAEGDSDDDVDGGSSPRDNVADQGFDELRTTGLGMGMGLGLGSSSGMAGMAGRPGNGYDSDDY